MADHPSCIDISHWQGFPDFEEVAAAGVVACIMKATEGTSFIDPNRLSNFQRATEAGIACCTYHWLSPGSDPVKQMQFYLDTVNPVRGERMIIDYEEDGCTLNHLKAAVQALLDDSRGLQVTVYSGHLLKDQLDDNTDEFLKEHTDLWLAQYTSGTPTWPENTYETWALWQYSETGEVPGIHDTFVDLNEFFSTDQELVEWVKPVGAPGPVPPMPEGEVVQVMITAPDSVTVKVHMNGDEIISQRRLRRRKVYIPRGPDLKR